MSGDGLAEVGVVGGGYGGEDNAAIGRAASRSRRARLDISTAESDGAGGIVGSGGSGGSGGAGGGGRGRGNGGNGRKSFRGVRGAKGGTVSGGGGKRRRRMESLVSKWQSVQNQESEGSSEEDDSDTQYGRQQPVGEDSARGANLVPVSGDWRERIKRRKGDG